MKYFAAFLRKSDPEKSQIYRQRHMEFLKKQDEEGNIFARGRFAKGEGGLVIYIASSYEDALKLAQSDPYVSTGSRILELYEWELEAPPKR
jgi:uncharacterized protein